MKIRVESVGDAGWIVFSSELGEGEAEWPGPAPRAGSTYHVELELAPPVEIAAAVAATPLLDARRERTLARARVEDCSDGLAILRLGDDARAPLLWIEAEGLQPGGWVALRAGALSLYDQNL